MAKREKDKRDKKSNHEGSYTERKDGTWMGRITIDGVSFCCYGKSEAEVKRKVKEHRKNVIKDGNTIKRMTVAKWIEEWLEVNKKPNITAPSYSRLLRTYKNQIQEVEEGRLILRMQLGSVAKNDIQKLINKLEETLSFSTVKKAHLFLCEAFNDAVENRYMSYNPALLAKKKKEENYNVKTKETCSLNKEDVQAFLNEALRTDEKGRAIHQYGATMVLQLFTGCRSGEVRALTWGNIDFENLILKIRHSVEWVKDESPDAPKKTKIYISDTKTAAGKRDIPFNTVATACLNTLKERAEKLNNPLDLVVPTRNGWYLTDGNYNKYIGRVLDNIGTARMSSHSLRHTFISLLVNDENRDIATVAKIVGHNDIRVTLKYARHTEHSKKIATMKTLDRLFEIDSID